MIDLCNRLQVDPWFCIPHLADDDYVRQFATMVRERLDPKLKVYVEHSNEVWNGQFAQARYAKEEGRRLGLSDNDFQAQLYYHSMRSVQIFADLRAGVWGHGTTGAGDGQPVGQSVGERAGDGVSRRVQAHRCAGDRALFRPWAGLARDGRRGGADAGGAGAGAVPRRISSATRRRSRRRWRRPGRLACP